MRSKSNSLIDQGLDVAMHVAGRSKVDCSAGALGAEATCSQTVKVKHEHKLTPADAACFVAALEAPVVVTARAVKAANSFAVRVVHAD